MWVKGIKDKELTAVWTINLRRPWTPTQCSSIIRSAITGKKRNECNIYTTQCPNHSSKNATHSITGMVDVIGFPTLLALHNYSSDKDSRFSTRTLSVQSVYCRQAMKTVLYVFHSLTTVWWLCWRFMVDKIESLLEKETNWAAYLVLEP